MLPGLFETDYHWYWWTLACILLAFEALAPGIIFLWTAISAIIVGCLVLFFPEIAITLQLFLFSLIGIISVLAWRVYLQKFPTETDEPMLNQRGAQHIGQTFTVVEPIVNGVGKVSADASIWKVIGPDCPSGTMVKVVGTEGIFLRVKPIIDTKGEL